MAKKRLNKAYKNPLGIDVGGEWGWYIGGASGTEKSKKLADFYKKCQKLVKKNKPDIIITALPTYNRNVMWAQTKMVGVLQLIAEESKIDFYDNTDSHFRSHLCLKNKKDVVIDWAGLPTEHECDAMVFAEYAKKKEPEKIKML